jgi:regulator of protease activity HflC (stomatin/prohibitin superfamily)
LKYQNSQNWQALVGGIIAAALILLSFSSFVIINPGQAGVISILGKARDGALLEGIHLKPPLISTVDIYDVTVQKFEVQRRVPLKIFRIYRRDSPSTSASIPQRSLRSEGNKEP